MKEGEQAPQLVGEPILDWPLPTVVNTTLMKPDGGGGIGQVSYNMDI